MFDILLKHIIHDAVTLFVIIDPISLVPLFIALTSREDPAQRRKIALRATALAAIVLIGFIIVGQFLLDSIEISLSAFQIGGGLVLMIIGLKMVFDDDTEMEALDLEEGNEKPILVSDVAVFPLATPLIAGPGAIMAVVLLTDNDKYSPLDQVTTAVVVLAILSLTYFFLRQSDGVQNWLGRTGTSLVTRILGLLVVAFAIQTMLVGISSFFGLVKI
mgnify:CR=1 FL=1